MRKFGIWLQNRPRFLERLYNFVLRLMTALNPLIKKIGYERVERVIWWPEDWAKKMMFNCQMCGQCVLHSTGMTCPMSCPKDIRNGPCGGVRQNGHCEVKPAMRCVWVEAFERSQKMEVFSGEMLLIQPPVNKTLGHRSAWITMLTGEDQVVAPGWE